jgi:signal transduction histidine kinase
MSYPLFQIAVTSASIAAVRNHARSVGELVGLDNHQLTRFTTALSEIARNAVQYASQGTVAFSVEEMASSREQALVAEVVDQGPGIADLPGVMRGEPNALGRVPMGITGSTRLVDRLTVQAPAAGGTLVRIEMSLRGRTRLAPQRLATIAAEMTRRNPVSPLEEMGQQNRELLKVLRDLREKQSELEQVDLRKNQFVTTLAHELRNPLATLQMSLEILRRKPTMGPDELAERREVMQRQVHQLSKLVEDLMDASRVSQGKVKLQLQRSELNALLSEAVEMTGGAVAAKSHDLSMVLDDQPLWVAADAPRLKQVFCNLIQNSARYTPTGGAIAIRVRRQQDDAVVEVRDNGAGIAADVLPHVFGLFVQGDATRAGHEGGLGVGLSLVRRLVQDHGGTVMAASAGLDAGSLFTVTLPLLPAA